MAKAIRKTLNLNKFRSQRAGNEWFAFLCNSKSSSALSQSLHKQNPHLVAAQQQHKKTFSCTTAGWREKESKKNFPSASWFAWKIIAIYTLTGIIISTKFFLPSLLALSLFAFWRLSGSLGCVPLVVSLREGWEGKKKKTRNRNETKYVYGAIILPWTSCGPRQCAIRGKSRKAVKIEGKKRDCDSWKIAGHKA